MTENADDKSNSGKSQYVLRLYVSGMSPNLPPPVKS